MPCAHERDKIRLRYYQAFTTFSASRCFPIVGQFRVSSLARSSINIGFHRSPDNDSLYSRCCTIVDLNTEALHYKQSLPPRKLRSYEVYYSFSFPVGSMRSLKAVCFITGKAIIQECNARMSCVRVLIQFTVEAFDRRIGIKCAVRGDSVRKEIMHGQKA